MEKATDICYLDYLVGTLATAYKGLVTSLEIREGTSISIDGSTGIVYSGNCLLTVKDNHY